MKAAFIENGQIHVGECAAPEPGKGQALVRTHAGLCASEAHFLHAGQNVIDLSRRFGGPYAQVDFSRPFVPGHEYVGEVLDYGAGSRRPVKPGRMVTSIPIMRAGGQVAAGKEPQDMALALAAIADGRIDVAPWIGARIGLGGVAQAFAEMSGPDAPVRVLVDPRRL